MRITHFERWQPVCPACRAADRGVHLLALAHVIVGDEQQVTEGALACDQCRLEFPIIDGIPIIVADVRGFIAGQIHAIEARGDFSPWIESLLGDATGPGSVYETTRYHLSTYCRGHYGDLDPERADAKGSALANLLEQGLGLHDQPLTGDWLDIGCSVGRGTFEIARHTGGLALGIDMNFSMLRVAQAALSGLLRYPLRRVGLVYDRREHSVEFPAADRVDFWACDATGLALADDRADGALSLNLLDCTPSPGAHLLEMGRVLRPTGHGIIATPYDWSSNATPLEAWIGGHSQRGDDGGSSAAMLRRILSDEAAGPAAPRMRISAERSDAEWRVYVHERATMSYSSHLLAVHGY